MALGVPPGFLVNHPAVAAIDRIGELAHLENEKTWNPDCLLAEPMTEPPVREGSKWRAKWKGGPEVEVEVYAYDRPRTLTTGNRGSLEQTVVVL